MEKFPKIGLIILCLCFVCLTVQAQNMSATKENIKKMNEEVEKAVLSNDGMSLMKYYADDAISMPSYQPMMKGKKAIEEGNMEMHKSGMKMTKFKLNTTDVGGNGNLVYEVGTYDLTLEMPSMPEPIDDHGKYLTIYEKQPDGSLMIKVETWNSDRNPWMGQDHEGMDDMDKMEKDDQDTN
ncbi:MAG: DUF4440 domain-containing protein [Ignavibacteriaceae bacterium]